MFEPKLHLDVAFAVYAQYSDHIVFLVQVTRKAISKHINSANYMQ